MSGVQGRMGRRRGEPGIRRHHPVKMWSSCYSVGGLLNEARLNPGFTEVRELEKGYF